MMRADLRGSHGYVLTKDPSATGPSAQLDVVLRIDAWRNGYAAGYNGQKPNATISEMNVWPTTLGVLKSDGWVTDQYWVQRAVTGRASVLGVHGVAGSRGAASLGNFAGRTR
jgi:hypothetical protein